MMASKTRNMTTLNVKENANAKTDVSKGGLSLRPVLRPISNRNLPTKPITRTATKNNLLTNKTIDSKVTTKVTCVSKPVPKIRPANAASKVVPKAGIKSVSKDVSTKVAPKLIVRDTNVKKPESYSATLNNVIDIDKDDGLSPQLAPPYANDIYCYLRELEQKYPILPAYLTGQAINGNMRALLLNWIVELHEEFHMFQESLHLAVGTLDRFLQAYRTIDRTKLQLVGATCLLIAGKYEELFGPEISDLVFMCQGAYTKSDIIEMECKILSVLDFNLGRPLPIHFLRRFSKAAKAEGAHHNLAKYIVELGLLDYSLCHKPPSLLAAAALYLSLWLFSGEKTLSENLWTDTLAFYSTYSYSDIRNLVQSLAVLLVKAETSKHQALRTKYRSSKYMKTSSNLVLQSKHLKQLATAPEIK